MKYAYLDNNHLAYYLLHWISKFQIIAWSLRMGKTWSSACPHLVFYKCQQVWMSFGLVEVLPGKFIFLECHQNPFKVFINLQWDGSYFEIL